MDPTDLPEEVAERIFILLPVEDLLNCCLVSSRWRDAINKNIIWKRHCNPNINLESMESVVNPAFEEPKCDCEDLTPVCKYRISYMRECHLRNNFRNNRCKSYKFSRSHIENKTEFLDRYLLLNDSYKNMFHVWDVEEKPCQVQSVPYLLQQMCTQTFQAQRDRLVIVQCNLLQVYIVEDGFFTLKFCRIFDKEEDFSHTIPENDITSWYSDNIGLYPCDFTSYNEIVGNYFIGIVEPVYLNDSIMHIWNLETGEKLKTDTIPNVAESIESICCGNNTEYLYIALYLHINRSNANSARCKIFSYNFKTLEYTDFFVESDHSIPFMMFEKCVVILPCDQWENSGCYMFLDAVTGKKIVEKKYENPINPKAMDVHDSLMVFGSDHTVTVVDLNTQEEVVVFPIDFEVMEVYLLDYNMLLVGGVDYHFVLEVWDIRKSCRLYSLGEKSILFCGRTLSRLSLQSMHSIHVLHFW